jgi:chromosome segregation ATPase
MTPTPAKPSKFIAHLTEQLHAREAEVKQANACIAKLESELAAERADRQRGLDALADEIESRGNEVGVLNSQLVQGARSFEALTIRVSGLQGTIEAQRAELGASEAIIHGLEQANASATTVIRTGAVLIDALKARIAELEQRGAHLDAKEAELKVLVAKVEERGRRREAEEAAAILNRRAVASAVPGRIPR